MTDPPSGHDLASLPLGDVGYRVYTLLDHPLARLDRIGLAALETEMMVVPDDGALTRRVLLEAFAAAGRPHPPLLKAGTFPFVEEAVLHGVGIGVMLEDCVLADPRLIALPIERMDRRYGITPTTQPERRHLRLIASVFELCAEDLDQPRAADPAAILRRLGASADADRRASLRPCPALDFPGAPAPAGTGSWARGRARRPFQPRFAGAPRSASRRRRRPPRPEIHGARKRPLDGPPLRKPHGADAGKDVG